MGRFPPPIFCPQIQPVLDSRHRHGRSRSHTCDLSAPDLTACQSIPAVAQDIVGTIAPTLFQLPSQLI
ncbi:hypothetical protein J6590_076083 [Homalodisca vitripennis]|nr:hypothetical protein J6590_076083 [Homalodisca vitripennis]